MSKQMSGSTSPQGQMNASLDLDLARMDTEGPVPERRHRSDSHKPCPMARQGDEGPVCD